jgi:hypothetical protein
VISYVPSCWSYAVRLLGLFRIVSHDIYSFVDVELETAKPRGRGRGKTNRTVTRSPASSMPWRSLSPAFFLRLTRPVWCAGDTSSIAKAGNTAADRDEIPGRQTIEEGESAARTSYDGEALPHTRRIFQQR